MRYFRATFFSLFALGVAQLTLAQETGQSLLSVGVTGSAPSNPAHNPSEILASPEMQRLILAIAERPHRRDEIETAIAGQSFTLADMVAVGLLREEGGQFWIDFNLLRVEDQRRILEVSEDLGRDLAEAFFARREDFAAFARGHKQPGDFSAEFLYFVLGCFSLDWDGLDLTEERGWRLGAQRVLDGEAFTPWAKEKGAEISLRGLFWGSHNTEVAGIKMTTFGDHHTLPRFALPDLLWRNAITFRGYEDLKDETWTATLLLAAYEEEVMADAGRVMMALGREPLDAGALTERTGITGTTRERMLSFLEAARYAEKVDEKWRASILVLQPEDAGRVAASVALGRKIMLDWHETHYAGIREALSDLTPIRNGVPFERVYTEIWHFVFGFANRTLVEDGLFADPYADDRRFRGFLPLVWDASLGEAP